MNIVWSSERLEVGSRANPNYYAKITYGPKETDKFLSFLIYTIYEELALKNPDFWVSVRDINNILEVDCRSYIEDDETYIVTIREMNDEQFILYSRLVRILNWLDEHHVYHHCESATNDALRLVLNGVNKDLKQIMKYEHYSINDKNETENNANTELDVEPLTSEEIKSIRKFINCMNNTHKE